MLRQRIQEAETRWGVSIRAPWGWRNSGMGGRHTEKEYPQSNISMQEAMFIPLSAKTYEDAQRMVVELQTRLHQIINKVEGARVEGIGLEGGLATYIEKDPSDLVPEQRLWRLMVQAIKESGFKPGEDVVLAFDPAASELEIAYREKYEQPDAVGMYLFWRDANQVVMSRDQLMDLYDWAIENNIPLISGEDLFAEDDYEGWKLAMAKYGDVMFIIGDDVATTNAHTVEFLADEKLINTLLVKANQIGSLAETLLAMLTGLGKGLEMVVSHRSKSPNDDMEAQVALSVNAVGLKAGGGANTERLVKYGAIIKMMKEAILDAAMKDSRGVTNKELEQQVTAVIDQLQITRIVAYEESTNAGIPTAGATVSFGIPGSLRYESLFKMSGSTPLGTSAGTGEAIHLIDSNFAPNELTAQYPDLFDKSATGTYSFKKSVDDNQIIAKDDAVLTEFYKRANRYSGKGVLNAVSNVEKILAEKFVGKKLSELGGIENIDKVLLEAEFELGVARGLISRDAPMDEKIKFMQRKGNIGMNALLSTSLALGRMVTAMQGKELWQTLRETMATTIARTIAESEGVSAQELEQNYTFEQLVEKLQKFEQARKERKDERPLYAYLEAALPVYGEADGGSQVQDGGLKTDAQEVVEQQTVAVEQQAAAANQAPEELGGVDLRALPVSVKPVDASRVVPVNSALLKMSLQDLDKTWTDLRGKVEGQAVPYQQLKEYVAACKSRADAAKQLAQVRRYIGELLKLEEERAIASSSEMHEIVGIIG